LEAATLVGRHSEECCWDSPPALRGAAIGRADGQHGGGRLESARCGASLMLAPEAEPTDPGSLRCAACSCPRRVPEAPPLLALPPSTTAAAAARGAPQRARVGEVCLRCRQRGPTSRRLQASAPALAVRRPSAAPPSAGGLSKRHSSERRPTIVAASKSATTKTCHNRSGCKEGLKEANN